MRSRRTRRGGSAGWRLAAVPLLLSLAMGCAADEEEAGQSEECLTAIEVFARDVWEPLMSTTCIACHNPQGAAKATKLVLKSPSTQGYLEANFETVKTVASYQYEGTSLLLLKPTARISHGGGEVVKLDSAQYAALEGLVQRMGEPETCTKSGSDVDAFYEGVSLLGPEATFRRAAIALAGRVPTVDEEGYLAEHGDEGLRVLVRDLLLEDAFYERLMETFNDALLTDKYLPGGMATSLLSKSAYPHRSWWDDEDFEASAAARGAGEKWGNASVAREPLQLVAHVVKNGKPFTEVLTADYILVNPLSARSYGVYKKGMFADETDPDEWKPAKLPGVPHAGVLTSAMVLNRFPTTETNRNRHRARKVFDIFLATDVLALAERPIDPTSIQDHNPTMFNANCTVCHAMIDPVAGAFSGWTAEGRYELPEGGWYPDMRPPGFGEDVVPTKDQPKALRWLAKRVADDERFAGAAVQLSLKMLTGEEPLQEPSAADETLSGPDELEARRRAYKAQAAELEAVRAKFVESGHDLRVAIEELAVSRLFRVAGAAAEVIESREHELSALGPGHLLPPEQLSRKIAATTGYPWRSGPDGKDRLLSSDYYRILYGGIDSDQVIARIDEPNGLVAAIGVRMANEMACLATARDFSLPASARLLFPGVEVTYEPEDDNGFPVPAAREAIEHTIAHLHAHLLGEVLPDGDPEIAHTYALWEGTWRDGRAAVASEAEPESLPWPCAAKEDWWTGDPLPDERVIHHDERYTVRAWMAVVAYLLSDHRFLHE